jgi:hypothetical protein
VIVEDKKPEIVDDKVEPKKSSKKTKKKKKSKKSTKKKAKKEPKKEKEEEKKEEITQADYLEVEDMLKKISTEKQEVKHLLWKHFAWDMAKEFMYGLAIGVFVGLILSRILLP